MAVDLSVVERMAPDQSALKAAASVAKPGKWPLLAQSADGALVWGECQGSGANPYRVMADTADLGNKCTCPSRKFPCKHVLGLLVLAANAGDSLPTAEPPAWVVEWLGRRRKTGGTAAASAGSAAPQAGAPSARSAPAGDKDLQAALAGEPTSPPAAAAVDLATAARRQAATEKRAADTVSAILGGLDDLEQWLADQLRLGLAGFLNDPIGRCRRIAARLVDAKAASLAGRLDDLPARLLELSTDERPGAAMAELGRLLLLARAFRADPADAELKRQIVGAESRDDLLADPAAPRIDARWEVAGERVTTRRDGLIAQETWLLNLAAVGPRFALLLDFYPASAGRRSASFTAGDQFDATIVFFPAKAPLRAVIEQRREGSSGAPAPWPATPPGDPLADYVARQGAAPWMSDLPVLLPRGHIATDSKGHGWWRADDDAAAVLPLAGTPSDMARGAALDATVAIWTGTRARLLAAQTVWGRIDGSA